MSWGLCVQGDPIGRWRRKERQTWDSVVFVVALRNGCCCWGGGGGSYPRRGRVSNGARWRCGIKRSKEGVVIGCTKSMRDDAGWISGGAASGRRAQGQTHGGAEESTDKFFLHFILLRSRVSFRILYGELLRPTSFI
jgi:hypothetical protein